MGSYAGAFKKYAVLSGRAPRREFWFFVLFHLLATYLVALVAAALSLSTDLTTSLIYVYWGVALLPGLAVTVRRLHDTGRTGWWTSIALVPFVGPLVLLLFLVQKGTQADNRFGSALAAIPQQTTLAVPTYGAVDLDSLSEPAARVYHKARLRQKLGAASADLVTARKVEGEAGQRVHDARRSLDDASVRLAALESGRGDRLATLFGEATLCEYWIDLPGYSGPVQGATARIARDGSVQHVSDVTGTTKGGLGGAVAGGLLLGPVGAIVGSNVARKTTVETKVRQVDTRHSELEVIGPGFAWSTRVLGESDDMTRFRDLVNARGSANDDPRSLMRAQADRVERLRQDLEALHAHLAVTASSASTASEIHSHAQAEFRAARCSLLDRLQAWREGLRPVSTVAVSRAVTDVVAPAGWYADPVGGHQHRYWDGDRWTDHVADDGVAGQNPSV